MSFDFLQYIFADILQEIFLKAIEKIKSYFEYLGSIVRINYSEAIIEILNKSFITVAEEYGYTIKNAPKFTAFTNCDTIINEIRDGLKIFVYKKRGKMVGCAGNINCLNGIYEIKNFAVLPDFRHKGIGKKLLAYNEKEIKKIGGKTVEVGFLNNNDKLKQWFKKYGYNEIGIKEIKGLPYKICIMQKKVSKNN